jgi:chemotaxis protein methyltransferase CheR
MNPEGLENKLESLETDLLLEAVYRYYGYDFRNYEPSAVHRRIRETMLACRISTVSRFQEKLLHEPVLMSRFLRAFSSTGLTLFSDPNFFKAFRSNVVPKLRTYAFIRVWHAGCSTGEDVYSMAILLKEEGLYARSRIYATDLSEIALKQARVGSYRASAIEQCARDYQDAGGAVSLSDYFKKRGNRLVIDPLLRKNIVFSEHNLATDGSLNEFQVIVCRNMLGMFNHTLRERVGNLINESLGRFGILALGRTQSFDWMPLGFRYELINEDGGLYQKLGSTGIATHGWRYTKDKQRVER